MSLFSSSLHGALHAALVVLVGLAAVFHPHATALARPATPAPLHIVASSAASSSPPVISNKKAPSLTAAKKAVQLSHLPAPAPLPASTAPASSAPVSTPPPSAPELSPETVNATLRSSLVNILCTTVGGGLFRPISGSGVIIDTRGVILTNAHVAQFFLLKDYPFKNNIQCVVRTGSPAQA